MLFVGCKKKDIKEDNNNQTTTQNSENKGDAKVDDSSSTSGKTETTDSVKEGTTDSVKKDTPDLPETKEMLIYGIQNETLESQQVSVSIPKKSKITAEFIVDQVVDVFAENSLDIGIDSVTQEGDKVIVSFKADKAPLTNVGAGVETTILDSISMSLLDNLDTCKNVIFRVEGKAYTSGHIELGIDEVYKWK